jgi:hypothetical protein
MYLCYIDESGTSSIPGNTSHFILAGLAIPISQWRTCDNEIESIKKKYFLTGAEIHAAWILRPYLEQRKIPNFDNLDHSQRRSQVDSFRRAELFRLQRSGNPKHYKQVRKNYRLTNSYIHLNYSERQALTREIAQCIANWKDARLFAECIDKVYFDASKARKSIDEQAFEQLVSRFEQYLQILTVVTKMQRFGLLVHDNNQTVAKKLTELMREFHRQGTFWTLVESIIETPLFVESELTSMVQVADLCSYALRRYLENHDTALFNLIFQRADRKDGVTVGVRHYTISTCTCQICISHRKI